MTTSDPAYDGPDTATLTTEPSEYDALAYEINLELAVLTSGPRSSATRISGRRRRGSWHGLGRFIGGAR